MVFQHFNLFPHLTIIENLTLGPIKSRGMSKADAESLAMKYLERVRIPDQAHKRPKWPVWWPATTCCDRTLFVHGAKNHAL